MIKPYKNGYEFIFEDFGKVKYYHMKNFNCRVFISENRGAMRLLPQNLDEPNVVQYLIE